MKRIERIKIDKKTIEKMVKKGEINTRKTIEERGRFPRGVVYANKKKKAIDKLSRAKIFI